nr:MAG TPA: hypothetical protein [Caudoviricetes sp.]
MRHILHKIHYILLARTITLHEFDRKLMMALL